MPRDEAAAIGRHRALVSPAASAAVRRRFADLGLRHAVYGAGGKGARRGDFVSLGMDGLRWRRSAMADALPVGAVFRVHRHRPSRSPAVVDTDAGTGGDGARRASLRLARRRGLLRRAVAGHAQNLDGVSRARGASSCTCRQAEVPIRGREPRATPALACPGTRVREARVPTADGDGPAVPRRGLVKNSPGPLPLARRGRRRKSPTTRAPFGGAIRCAAAELRSKASTATLSTTTGSRSTTRGSADRADGR